MGFHMLAGGNVHLGQPFRREIASSGGVIFLDIAGNIGQLEGKSQIAGPVKRLRIIGINAHNQSHHHPDRAGHMITILHQIPLCPGTPTFCIERKSGNHIIRQRRVDAAFL